ncbi:hypothetical protein M409DRAFT_60648 [Zasmidium cellare ATCC 36951]|uniref:XPG-I domain-containing protein n=1 Tax=Zasmidium cellare ATCC 36951 TaxID=1080233 RepID=A0A6A6BXL2_ZASCE|nr:uncharacterized protein M409DRAFT_60648 [Zasmidium cellare ATCC 36951]KAF2159574.1 hypothetical protein M409DRAFT_60648 [Zasmidium cellare ATCC 36951]
MGINGLWNVLGDGEVWHVADYAAKHFKETGRPLRIAVDEATWRFANLTPEKVEEIRQGVPAAAPAERTILWRILRLWRLNIQLLFVYDGLRKPGQSRRGDRGGGKVDKECIRLLNRMFDLLKVPYHQAPGEAEAECAKLQRLGIVDAVWSDDGDSFMFGCNTLIKAQRAHGELVKDHIRVYKADAMAEKLDFDADSLVLFALLAGGDYDPTGLRGCGPVNAAWVCRRSFGLAKRIVNISPPQMGLWRHYLGHALRDQIPPDFPTLESSMATEARLSPRMNSPVTFAAFEAAGSKPLTSEAFVWSCGTITTFKLPNTTSTSSRISAGKDAAGNPTKCEVKIMYSAHELVEIDLSAQPPDEDWSEFAEKDGTPYDPRNKIEYEMLECLLQHGLPEGSWDAPAKAKKGKARTSKDDGSLGESSDQKQPVDQVSTGERTKAPPKKRGRPPKDPSKVSTSQPARKKRKSKSAEVKSPSPPPSTFRHVELPDSPPRSRVVDLLDEDDDDHDSDLFSSIPTQPPSKKVTPAKGPPKFRPMSPKRPGQKAQNAVPSAKAAFKHKSAPLKRTPASQMSTLREVPQQARDEIAALVPPQAKALSTFPRQMSAQRSPQQLRPSPHEFVPGEAMDPRTLRELRLAAMQNNAANVSFALEPKNPRPKATTPSLVIDLT